MHFFFRAWLVLGQVYSFEETSLWVNPECSVYVDSTEAKSMANHGEELVLV